MTHAVRLAIGVLVAAAVGAVATRGAAGAAGTQSVAGAQAPGQNVVLIALDGVRWQELFQGADSALLSRRAGGVQDTAGTRKAFWRPGAEERRRTLFPFLWGTVAARGAIWGNLAQGSDAHVTNGLNFSYPGYNEMLVGVADQKIDRNDYGPNPNATVFEWLNSRRTLRRRVAAFATWSTFTDIFNRANSGVFVHAGWEPPPGRVRGTPERTIDRLYRTTIRYWDDNTFDALTQAAVLDYVKAKAPRVLFVGYGETDAWAHERRYDLHLRAAQRADEFIAELWRAMQAMPQYRNRTTFIITTDHGRGDGPTWTDHGKDVDGAAQIWIAMLGPGTPALGEVKQATPVTQSQIAATVATFMGEDYKRSEPRAAAPLVRAPR